MKTQHVESGGVLKIATAKLGKASASGRDSPFTSAKQQRSIPPSGISLKSGILRSGTQNAQFTNSKRSNVINTSKLFFRGLAPKFFISGVVALFTVALMAGMAFGQNLVIGVDASFSGAGTYNVKGNITNAGVATAKSISGTVQLNGTLQDIGTATNGALTFGTLNALGTDTKTMKVNVTVSTALTVNNGAGKFLDVAALTLNIGGTSTLTSGSLNVSNASSVVNYTQTGGSQVALGLTYAGTLGMSGTSTKTLSAAASAGTLTHTDGGLTVDQDLTVTGTSTSSIGTLTNVSGTKTLLKNNTGTLTIATLSANAGTINLTAAGIINFIGAVTSGGTIQASAGTLDFDATVTNTSGTLTLTSSAAANFGGSFASQAAAGTLSFGGTSTVTYDGGSAQNAAGASYVNLNMSGAGVKTALGNLTIATGAAFNNGTTTTDMVTFTLALAGTATKTQASGGTMRFGGTGNGLLFTVGTVDYNGGALVTQTVAGHATDKYATLLFTGGGTKQIAAATRVATSGALTINSGVIVDVSAADSQLLVDGNLTVNGTLTNAGTVTVGN